MPNPANKPTIAVDIDDVLAASAKGFTDYSNKKWGTKLIPDDYDEHWAEMWGIDYEEEGRRRDHIIENQLFTTFKFYDRSLPILKKLSRSYKLVIASSRSKNVSEDTIEWVKNYYGNIFSEFHFANIWNDLEKHTKDKVKMTKTEILKQIDADYLIDDQPKHCITAAEAGITSVLFGDYRWNRDTELLPNMIRAKNWQEVLEYFDGQ